MVKFTVSNITDYHLKWPGIVENSTGKRKTSHIHFALLNSDPELSIHLFQKTLSERTVNGSCRTEIARPKGTVVSIFGMQKQ